MRVAHKHQPDTPRPEVVDVQDKALQEPRRAARRNTEKFRLESHIHRKNLDRLTSLVEELAVLLLPGFRVGYTSASRRYFPPSSLRMLALPS